MKRVPIPICETRKQEFEKDFFSEQIVPIGMKYIPPKDETDEKNLGNLSLLFLFENKLDSDDVIYVESMYKLEDPLELYNLMVSPFCMDTWDDEFKENNYKKIMEKYTLGKNVYGSDFTFTKTGANGEEIMSDTAKSLLEGIVIPKDNSYYTFQAVYSHEDTNLDTVRKINLDKGSWLQLSQFIYWVMLSMPLAPNLFTLDSYKKAKFIEVHSMMYDACTEVLFGPDNQDTVMSHFTIYFDNTFNVGSSFGFNIPVELVPERFLSQYAEADEYVKAYAKDDTILPSRVFTISSPDKMCCLLTGLDNENIIVFYLTPETAVKLDWMNWSKYIYPTIEEDKS